MFGGRWTPKCNLFVGDALRAGGDPVKSVNGERRDPVAEEWGDRNSKIEGYRPLRPGEKPMPGDIMSDGEHVAVYTEDENGNPSSIGAPSLRPDIEGPNGDRITDGDWGFRKGQKNIVYWRCICDDPPESKEGGPPAKPSEPEPPPDRKKR